MTRLRMLMIVVLGVCTLCTATALAQLLSPGELTKAHQKLEGDDQCVQCHSSGRSVEASLCSKCHTDISTQRSQGRGLHGRSFKKDPCAHCHVEHRGLTYELVRWPGGKREAFDHSATGFALAGGHKGVACLDCHKQRNTRGAATFLGARDACASCHEDPHEKRFGDDCKGCHNDRAWKDVKLQNFDHTRTRFSLHGEHAQVKCAKCHGEPAKFRGIEFKSCTSCHEDPHRDRFGSECTSCHNESSWTEVKMSASAHPGLSLLGGHSKVECASCHDQGLSSAPKKGSRCVSCHAQVHEATFGNNCAECHKRIQWSGLPDALSREVHARTVFPLRDKHEQVDCAECHSPKQPPRQRFRELRYARCLDCHEDTHRGEFSRRDGGECAACHDERGFRPSRFDHETHASTSFPLEGRHIAVPCATCHGAERPRVDFRLNEKTCADCHDNPHGEQFAAEMKVDGCAHCHGATGWADPKIDHGAWPLTGAHASAACGACHNPSAEDKKSGRGGSYRGAPRDCEGCHEDEHLGQFRLTEPVRACNACHDTTTFSIERFDHARMTEYALDGEHAKASCESCHKPITLRNGDAAIRYRLTYARCGDCHADPHSDPGGAGGAPGSDRHRSITQALECSACHTPQGWKQLAGGTAGGTFDHARTGFPLTGRHKQSACTGCHTGEQRVTRDCVGCHVDVHQRRLGERCDDCHSASSFTDVRALERHRQTRLPLTGMHALADCTACHQRIGDRRWSSAPADCYACHARDYRRTDIHPVHRGGVGTPPSAPFPRDCTQCHRATGWSPAVIASGDLAAKLASSALQRAPASHELVFPIARGVHRGAACNDCHRSEAVPRAVQCTGCHAHGPVRLAEQHKSVQAFARGSSCLTCHPGGAPR